MILILFCVFSARFTEISSVSLDGRLIGGTVAPAGYLPFVASIRCSNRHEGVGVIVSEKCVVTTAYLSKQAATDGCVVVVGSNKLSSGGTTYKISGSVVHPGFIPQLNTYNIGIVKLSEEITFTDKIKAIRLSATFPSAGTRLITAGWGQTFPMTDWNTPEAVSDSLIYMNFTAAAKSDCRNYFYIENPDNPEFCSVPNGQQGICGGDGGGPAILNNELVGVLGLINPYCDTRSSGLFCSISYVYDWIVKECDLCQ